MQNSKIFAGETAEVFENNEKKEKIQRNLGLWKKPGWRTIGIWRQKKENDKKGENMNKKMSHKMKEVKEKLLISKEK